MTRSVRNSPPSFLVSLAQPEAPAMPVLAYFDSAGQLCADSVGQPFCDTTPPMSKRQQAKLLKAQTLNEEMFRQRGCLIESSEGKPHVDHIAPRGHAGDKLFACVHTPLPIPKVLRIPSAKDALDK